MTNKELMTKVRKHKGAIYVAMLIKDDVIPMKVAKAELLKTIDGVADDALGTYERDGALYLDAAA